MTRTWTKTLSLNEMSTSLIVILCSLIAPLLADNEAVLPAPQNISILSINMKHILMWSPVIVPGDTVRYSVEFQGEYERDYADESWIPISECSYIIMTQCNVTEDISATVPYNLRVRANLGSHSSKWSTLEGLFNRITTFLTPPMMKVIADGYHLLVELEELGPGFQFLIVYWRKGQENVVYKKAVKEVSSMVHLDIMEAGADYCVKAQTYVEAINRSSNFSQTQCVCVQDGTLTWLTVTVMSFAGFVVGVLALPFLAWKMTQVFQYSCCPDVALPDTLKIAESSSKLIHCRSEETEDCDTTVCVIASEELLRLWIQETL